MIVEHRNLGAAFRRLALPEAAMMASDQVLGIVDTIVIGSLGTTALAGITGATTVLAMVAITLYGFNAGLSILGAQRIGAADLNGFGTVVRASALVPLACGALIFFASIVLGEPLLARLIGPLASVHSSAIYLMLRCASLVPMVVSMTVVAAFSAAGNTRIGLRALVMLNVLHFPILLVLALGWGTHHPLGIVGAGISSLIAEIAVAAYLLRYAARRGEYRIFSSLRIEPQIVKRLLALSWPEVVFLLAMLLPDIIILGMLAPLGAAVIAAYRALNIINDLSFAVPIPLGSAAQTVIAQRLGARDLTGARVFARRALPFAVIASSLTAAVIAALAWPLAALFTWNPALASLAAGPIAVYMLTLPLKGIGLIGLAPIRASGDTRFAMVAGLVAGVLVLPMTYWLLRAGFGLYAIPIAWLGSWSARAVITLLRLGKDDWAGGPLELRAST